MRLKQGRESHNKRKMKLKKNPVMSVTKAGPAPRSPHPTSSPSPLSARPQHDTPSVVLLDRTPHISAAPKPLHPHPRREVGPALVRERRASPPTWAAVPQAFGLGSTADEDRRPCDSDWRSFERGVDTDGRRKCRRRHGVSADSAKERWRGDGAGGSLRLEGLPDRLGHVYPRDGCAEEGEGAVEEVRPKRRLGEERR